MPTYKRDGSPHLWVRGSIAGEKYRLSSGTTDEGEAEEFEHALRERLWRKHKLGDRGAVSVRETAAKWLKTLTNKTKDEDRAKMEWFLSVPKVADSMIRDVTVEVNEELQQVLILRDLAHGTVDKYMATWRRFLRKCALEWTLMPVAPKVPMFNEDSEEPRWFTPVEYRTLFKALPPNLKPKAHFAVHTGLRMRAMLSLKRRNVDLKKRRAWIEAKYMKAGKTHGFPLSSEAMKALEMEEAFRASQEAEHLRRCERLGLEPTPGDSEHVFTYRRKMLDDCNTEAYAKALAAANIQEADWHTLRHTFASWAVQGGVTLQELMKLGPWESYDMVLRYAHLAPDSLGDAVSRVARMGHTAKRQKSAR